MKKIFFANTVKEEFDMLPYNNGKEPGHPIFKRDTQSSRKGYYWVGKDFFLTFGFKDASPFKSRNFS
jgi:hypothetical protein